ncbi:MAG: MFS transporter, partial [Microbacterium sp.]
MTESPAADTPVAAPRRRVWPVLAVLTAATFWTVTAEMLPSGLLPAMSRDLGVSEGTIGVLVSAWAVTIASVGIPLVRLTLRVPRTVLLTVSLAVTAPANLVTALAPDFAVALAGRILAATAHGLFWALVVSYVATIVTPERLGRALSLVLAGPTLAGLAGLPAAALIAEHTGWRWVFAGLSLILALTALTVGLVLPRFRRSETPAGAEPAGAWDRSARGVV